MFLEEKNSDAPVIFRPTIDVSVKFKPKDGKFDIYHRTSKQTDKVVSVEIVPVNNSRFTIKAAQVAPGEFIWSGLYRSPKQILTVLKKSGNKTKVYAQGTWQDIKIDPNLKYTQMLYCLLKVQREGGIVSLVRAQFELQGISSIMWQSIASKGTDRVMRLEVSPKKTYKTEKGFFHEMTGEPISDIDDAAAVEGEAYAHDIKRMFDSEDASYEYHKQSRAEQVEMNGGATVADKPAEPVNVKDEEIPTINQTSEEQEVKIEDVPF